MVLESAQICVPNSNSDGLEFQLERVFFALDEAFGDEGVGALLVHLSSDRAELLKENLLRMLGPLRLNETHDFAALDQTERGPVTDVHLQDVPLIQLDLSLRQEVQVSVLEKRCYGSLIFALHDL